MRKLLTVILLISAIAVLGKVSPATRLICKYGSRPHSRGDSTSLYQPLMILVDDDSVCDQLRDMGVIIYNSREDILLTTVPREMFDSVESIAGVRYLSSAGPLCSNMDVARPFANVDAVQSGVGLEHGYDGTGIVVGFSDIGFDARHPAFAGHIGAIYAYDEFAGTISTATTEEEISAWTTDHDDQYHATHVGNILAGSYMHDDADISWGNPASLYGVASGSEIVATTSNLNDAAILAGVEDIIAYAKAKNAPAVINLSLGSDIGPHDGTDLVCRYLTMCADDAAICISAGNDGNTQIFATQLLDNDTPETCIGVKDRNSGTALSCSGIVDMYSDSDIPFDICIAVYDTDIRQIVWSAPWWSQISDDDEICIDSITCQDFNAYFSGEVMLAREVCPLNNRFNAAVIFDVKCDILSDRGAWSKYIPAITVRRLDQSTIRFDAFANGSTLNLQYVEGSKTVPGNTGTINDLATAEGVIAVGMCRSRNEVPKYPDATLSWNFTPGTVSVTSSFSTAEGLPRLPHFCAPGEYVVSALSSEYQALHPQTTYSAMVESGGDRFCWFAARGTSMSSPFAAGVFALWLQANPRLKPRDLLDIACTTAKTDYTDISDPRWGAGCIDAMAGLKHIVASVDRLYYDTEPVVTVSPDRIITVAMPGNTGSYSVYSIEGLQVDPSCPVRPGVYIVSPVGYSAVKIYVTPHN